MFDATTRLSLPLSATRVHPAHPAAGSATPGAATSRAQAEAASAPPVSGPPAAGAAAPRAADQPAAAPLVRPAWPDPGTVNLASELLALSTTTIAHTATLSLPETGADFWSMLATALPEGGRE